jgi:hypothetical protein
MVYRESFRVQSNHRTVTFHNVTAQAKDVVARSGIQNGIVVVYSHHTTCCVITQEAAFDESMTGLETLQQDFVDAFDSFICTPVPRRLRLPPNTTRTRSAATIPTRTCAARWSAGAKPSYSSTGSWTSANSGLSISSISTRRAGVNAPCRYRLSANKSLLYDRMQTQAAFFNRKRPEAVKKRFF